MLLGGVLLHLSARLRPAAAHLKGGARQPSRVQHNPHLLRALGGELACDQVRAPRGRRPRDGANLVARLVVAQAVELAAGPAQPQAALLQLDLARPHQVESGVAAALLGRGKHPNTLLRIGDRPAFHQPQPAAVAQKDPVHAKIAAAVRRGVQPVGHAHLQPRVRLLQHLVDNLGGNAQRRRMNESPGYGNLSRRRQSRRVEGDQPQHRRVPRNHHPDPVRMEERRNREQDARQQQQQRPRRKPKAQHAAPAPIGSGSRGHGLWNQGLHGKGNLFTWAAR